MQNPPETRQWRLIAKNWLPVIAMAALISIFSSESFSSVDPADIFIHFILWLFPGISNPRLRSIYYAIRKSAHWAEYLLLSILLLRALRSDPRRKWEKRHAVWALVIVSFYALGDEFHQSFVPNRMASFRDVIIDWFGGICGAFWMYLRHKSNRGPEGKARTS